MTNGSSDGTAVSAIAESEKPSETLSQFMAKVLNQLSLSAWLPSAALVLLTALIFDVASALNDSSSRSPSGVLARAFGKMTHVGIGGGLLLVAAVIVLTILTQAFSFEAIRALEGYWGTIPLVERAAGSRAQHFRTQATRLRADARELRKRAWLSARVSIESEQTKAIDLNQTDHIVRTWTPDMLSFLGAKIQGLPTDVQLADGDRRRALNIPWKDFAPPDNLRRLINIDRRLQDFPVEARVSPTRLGNILRTHEDATNRTRVETLVLESLDRLPTAYRLQHDDYRNRLDLYCSIVFVVFLLSVVGAGRLIASDWRYALAAAAVGLLLTWLFYRAALSSARVYGKILVTIAHKIPPPPAGD